MEIGKRALHNRERFYLATLQRPAVSHAASVDAQPRANSLTSIAKPSMQNGSSQHARITPATQNRTGSVIANRFARARAAAQRAGRDACQAPAHSGVSA